MADLDVADGLPDLSSLPANPDAQDTVKDFLDYTEFYPSDLVRSLTLIGQLDKTYNELTDRIHRLTKTYSNLPQLSADSRPDPLELRKQISAALDRALQCRESAFAEAARLYDVTERHKHRLSIIKRKLQALPEPPSRDPTPPPVSPQAARSRRQELDRGPRLTLHVGRHQQSARAARAEKGRGRHALASDDSASDSESGESPVRRSLGDGRGRSSMHKIKIPKTPKVRQPGVMGTNVHSSVAGISTSNALARLTPPPPDALPGSKYAPWFKLTEYEMALLRKQMKKNAIWVPSDVMIRRELARRGRGHENYLSAKARAEEAGEPFLDEDPLPVNFAAGSAGGGGETAGDGSKIPPSDDTSIMNRGMRLNEAKKLKRTRELEEANRQMKETGDFMKTLFSTTRASGQRSRSMDKSVSLSSPTADKKKRELARLTAKKRKRDESPEASKQTANDSPTSSSHGGREQSHESPAPKKLKIVAPKAHQTSAANSLSPMPTPTTVAESEHSTRIKTTTVQVPLAPPGPAGSSSPTSTSSIQTKLEESSDEAGISSSPQPKKALKVPVLAVSTPTATSTAAASRPRRESTAPLKDSDGTPDIVPPLKSPSTAVTTAASSRPSRQVSSRPSSRAGTTSVAHSIKAASAEPLSKPDRSGRSVSLRRASNASMPFTTFETASHPGYIDIHGAMSGRTRRKPAPGAVAADGEGKGKISRVNRRKGHKRKDAGQGGDSDEENDPNEPRYCVCNDVSFGEMIACDNKHCDGEWFHYSCVGIPEGTLPSRVAKWFCPPCRKILRIDEQGNPVEAVVIAVDRPKKPIR